jgi:hypothetical protein
LVHGGRGEGEADRGGPRRRERKDGRARQRFDDWQNGPAKQREKRGALAKKPAPTAWPTGQRERERERRVRGRELPLTGGSHLSGGASARARGLAGPSWAGWAALPFPFS